MNKISLFVQSLFRSRWKLVDCFKRGKSIKILFSNNSNQLILKNGVIFFKKEGRKEKVCGGVSQIYFTQPNIVKNKVAIALFSKKGNHIFFVWSFKKQSFEVYDHDLRVKSLKWIDEHSFVRAINYLGEDGNFVVRIEIYNLLSGLFDVVFNKVSQVSLSLHQLLLSSDKTSILFVYTSPFWVSHSCQIQVDSDNPIQDIYTTGAKRWFFDDNQIASITVKDSSLLIKKIDDVFVVNCGMEGFYIKDLRTTNGFLLVLLGGVWSDKIVLIDGNNNYAITTCRESEEVSYFESLRFHPNGFSFNERSLFAFTKYSYNLKEGYSILEKKNLITSKDIQLSLDHEKGYYALGKKNTNITNKDYLVAIYGNARINDVSLIYSAIARKFIETGGVFLFKKTTGDIHMPQIDFTDNNHHGFYDTSVAEVVDFLKDLTTQAKSIGLIGVSQGGLTVLDVLSCPEVSVDYGVSIAPYLGNYVSNNHKTRIVTAGHSSVVLKQEKNTSIQTPILSIAAYHDDRCLRQDFEQYFTSSEVKNMFPNLSCEVNCQANHKTVLHKKTTKQAVNDFITKQMS